MMAPHPRCLLVEGEKDKRVIPELMENYIAWPKDKDQRPAHIEPVGSIDELLKPGVIEAKIKTPGLQSLGIIVDADEQPLARWAAVRARCLKAFPDFPAEVPEDGLIAENRDGLRLGVWLMPDNRAVGMLETFLSYFIPPASAQLWNFVQECCDRSREHQSPFKALHLDKARIHTWLAWQDPPGEQLHLAFRIKALQPGAPQAEAFANWFCNLFSIARRAE